MGGVAGHFGAGLDESEPGWWGRNLAPHEVSAVTGACLMVARSKFEAVDRFDEIHLPVDLNDVDLCLRLAERGWRTICHSQVVLIHHQSASRGGGLRLQQVYERERRFFRERWRAVIRDDPYFHPGLSLTPRRKCFRELGLRRSAVATIFRTFRQRDRMSESRCAARRLARLSLDSAPAKGK
ncbi:glycosyltransferase family 2 protein [Methylocystis sp. S23]